MKTATVACLGVAVLLGGVTYVAKQKVISLEEELTRLNRQIMVKKESKHLLLAEWGHLGSPARLQGLVESHLNMGPVEGWQVVSVQEVAPDHQIIRQGAGPVRLARAR